MAHFNASKVTNWQNLSDHERWHAGYCARKLDDSGLVRCWRYGCVHMVEFTSLADDERYETWLAESLLVALTHPEPIIAFRALLQACEYMAKANGVAHYNDSLTCAKLRIEACLPPRTFQRS